MLINKIELINFRQFKDKVTIEFSTDPERKITFITANGGTGKSTLSNAFLWCLYGETSFSNKKLLNGMTEDSMLIGSTEMVKVSISIIQNNQEYVISRKQTYEKGPRSARVLSNEFAVATIVNGNREYLHNSAANVLIKKILPQELSKFFFIGGERIETMHQEIQAGKSAAFSDAVRGLAGLTALMNLLNHYKLSIKESVFGKFNSEIDENGDVKLRSYSLQIQKIQKDILDREKTITENIPQIEGYSRNIIEDEKELVNLLPAEQLKDKVDKIDGKIKTLTSEKLDAVNNYLQMFSSKTMDSLSRCLIKASLIDLKEAGNLDKGIPDMRDTTIKYLIKRGYCICGNPLGIGEDPYQKVIELLDVLPPKSIGQMINDFVINSKHRVRNSDNYFKNLEDSFRRIRQISEKIEQETNLRIELFEQITDTTKAPYLRNKIRSDKGNKIALENESIRLTAENLNLLKDIKLIEAEREKLINIGNNNASALIYREYARLILDEYLLEYKEKESSVKTELQDRINSLLAEIFDPYIQIELDEKYNIKVNILNAEVVNKEILNGLDRSTSQAYSVIFAFISGLISMSKESAKANIQKMAAHNNSIDDIDPDYIEAYPLIMDAPLSVFDKKRIKNICNVLPEIADQLVFFIKDTDGDIAQEHLAEKIGMKWTMIAENNLVTTVERNM